MEGRVDIGGVIIIELCIFDDDAIIVKRSEAPERDGSIPLGISPLPARNSVRETRLCGPLDATRAVKTNSDRRNQIADASDLDEGVVDEAAIDETRIREDLRSTGISRRRR